MVVVVVTVMGRSYRWMAIGLVNGGLVIRLLTNLRAVRRRRMVVLVLRDVGTTAAVGERFGVGIYTMACKNDGTCIYALQRKCLRKTTTGAS